MIRAGKKVMSVLLAFITAAVFMVTPCLSPQGFSSAAEEEKNFSKWYEELKEEAKEADHTTAQIAKKKYTVIMPGETIAVIPECSVSSTAEGTVFRAEIYDLSEPDFDSTYLVDSQPDRETLTAVETGTIPVPYAQRARDGYSAVASTSGAAEYSYTKLYRNETGLPIVLQGKQDCDKIYVDSEDAKDAGENSSKDTDADSTGSTDIISTDGIGTDSAESLGMDSAGAVNFETEITTWEQPKAYILEPSYSLSVDSYELDGSLCCNTDSRSKAIWSDYSQPSAINVGNEAEDYTFERPVVEGGKYIDWDTSQSMLADIEPKASGKRYTFSFNFQKYINRNGIESIIKDNAIYPTYERGFTLELYAEGGTLNGETSLYLEDEATVIADTEDLSQYLPVREGYDFVGWCTDREHQTETLISDRDPFFWTWNHIRRHARLYAVWAEQEEETDDSSTDEPYDLTGDSIAENAQLQSQAEEDTQSEILENSNRLLGSMPGKGSSLTGGRSLLLATSSSAPLKGSTTTKTFGAYTVTYGYGYEDTYYDSENHRIVISGPGPGNTDGYVTISGKVDEGNEHNQYVTIAVDMYTQGAAANVIFDNVIIYAWNTGINVMKGNLNLYLDGESTIQWTYKKFWFEHEKGENAPTSECIYDDYTGKYCWKGTFDQFDYTTGINLHGNSLTVNSVNGTDSKGCQNDFLYICCFKSINGIGESKVTINGGALYNSQTYGCKGTIGDYWYEEATAAVSDTFFHTTSGRYVYAFIPISTYSPVSVHNLVINKGVFGVQSLTTFGIAEMDSSGTPGHTCNVTVNGGTLAVSNLYGNYAMLIDNLIVNGGEVLAISHSKEGQPLVARNLRINGGAVYPYDSIASDDDAYVGKVTLTKGMLLDGATLRVANMNIGEISIDLTKDYSEAYFTNEYRNDIKTLSWNKLDIDYIFVYHENRYTNDFCLRYITVDSLQIEEDSTCTIPAGMSAAVRDLDVNIKGTLVNKGTFTVKSTDSSKTHDISVTGTMENRSGSTLSLDGSVVFRNSGTTSSKGNVAVGSSAEVVNGGNLTITGSMDNSGKITSNNQLNDHGTITNTGTLVNTDTMNVTGELISSGGVLRNSGYMFVNEGGEILLKGTGSVSDTENLLENSGEIYVDKGGSIRGDSSCSYTSVVNSGILSSSVDMSTEKMNLTNKAKGTIINAGNLVLAENMTNEGTVRNNSGTVTVKNTFTQKGTVVNASGAVFEVEGWLEIEKGSTFENKGTVINDKTILISGEADNTVFRNYGVLRWNMDCTETPLISNFDRITNESGSQLQLYMTHALGTGKYCIFTSSEAGTLGGAQFTLTGISGQKDVSLYLSENDVYGEMNCNYVWSSDCLYLQVSGDVVAWIPSDQDLSWTGSEVEPLVLVKGSQGEYLNPDTEYTVQYVNNGTMGTAWAIVTLRGRYTGTKTVYFEITPRDISNKEIVLAENGFVYDGTAQKPTLSIEGIDLNYCDVTYSNNVNAGTATICIKGNSIYTGTAETTFTIARADISNKEITLDAAEVIYDGTAKKPEVTVEGLKASDYDVYYSNNINIGTATVTVTGKDNYCGSISKTYEITPCDISDREISLDTSEFTYDGTEKRPAVTIDGLDSAYYNVYYDDNVAPGTATVTVEGVQNYTGSITKTFTIGKGDISTADAELEQTSFEYSSAGAYVPEPVVTCGEQTLVKDTDYTLSYDNNMNAGTATITITGIGSNWTGTRTLEFTITPVDISGDWCYAALWLTEGGSRTLIKDSTLVYDGKAKTIEADIPGLTSGTDFEYVNSNTVAAGKGQITITGKGNYTGTRIVEYTINPASLSDKEITLSQDSYVYDGTEKKPQVSVSGFAEGTDYDVTYSDNVNAGTATVTVTGKGSCTGSITKTFTIEKAEINVAGASWSGSKTYVYSGSKKTITLKGVPEGVTASKSGYYGTKVGSYTAKAALAPADPDNYVLTGSTAVKSYTWTIKPKKPTISKLTAGSKKLTVKMGSKVSSTGGSTYKVQYRVKGTSSWKTKTTTSQTITLKSLKKGKSYQVRVCAYRKVSGKTYTGSWSTIKNSGKVK